MVTLIIDELRTFTPLDWAITKAFFGIGALGLLMAAFPAV